MGWEGLQRFLPALGFAILPALIPQIRRFVSFPILHTDQVVLILSHPTCSHAGERGQLLLNMLFLREASWEGGQGARGMRAVCAGLGGRVCPAFQLATRSLCPCLPQGLGCSVPVAADVHCKLLVVVVVVEFLERAAL